MRVDLDVDTRPVLRKDYVARRESAAIMKFLRSASGSEMFLNGALCTPGQEMTTDPKLDMRPNTMNGHRDHLLILARYMTRSSLIRTPST